MTTLRDIGEDALIERLIELVPRSHEPSAGPGDDCAVIDHGPHSPTLLLLKTDALVSSIHFLPDAQPRAVGWKAAARVISDFAAMGGHPEHFLITLALPPETQITWVEDLYRGLGDCLLKWGGTLAGGETSSVPAGSAAVISIAAAGRVRREHLVLRSTAKPGDHLFVTGTLGGSISGKHLHFTPRLDEVSWLVATHKPSAMMDLSDGLAKDLPRMAAASQCGFQLEASSLPLTAGCTVAQALGDGEDYEILFSIDPGTSSELLIAWKLRFPMLLLTRIGVMVETSAGDTLAGGWEHFPRSDDDHSQLSPTMPRTFDGLLRQAERPSQGIGE
jgi:thiamine-monophosphate kinase